MDHRLYYSAKEYTLQMFLDEFQHSLPVMIEINEGYLGMDELHTVSGGEQFFIHHIKTQKRVLFRDFMGRHISIPQTYPFKFKIIKHFNIKGDPVKYPVEPMPLKKAMSLWKRGQEMTLQVENSSGLNFCLDHDLQKQTTFGDLEVLDIYDENYFGANSVLKSKTRDLLLQPFLLPAYMDLNLFIVQGFMEDNKTNGPLWKKFLKQAKEFVKTVSFDKLETNKEIIELPSTVTDNDDTDTYQYINPKNFIYYSLKQETQFGNFYESIGNKKPGSPPPKKQAAIQPRRPRKPRMPLPGEVKKDPQSQVPEDPVVQERNKKEPDIKYQKIPFLPQDNITGIRALKETDKLTRTTSTSKDTASLQKEIPVAPSDDKRSLDDKEGKDQRIPLPSPVGETTSTVGEIKCTIHAKIGNEANNDGEAYEEIVSYMPQAMPVAPPHRNANVRKNIDTIHGKDENDNEEQYGAERLEPDSAIQPEIPKVTHSSLIDAITTEIKTKIGNNEGIERIYDEENIYAQIKDVPQQTKLLSVNELAQCLKLLNMGNYVDMFKEENIDGDFLMHLDERVMKEKFNMSEFEARKLTRFAKGWRPKMEN